MGDLLEEASTTERLIPEPPFATLVAQDGTLIRLTLTRFGDLALQIGERQAKILDRFQVAALRVAVLSTAERH